MQNEQIEIQPCKKKKDSFLGELIRTIVPTAIITLLFLYLVGQLAIVCGNSMNNTLYDGDVVFMEKITQRFSNLDRFDIVVFDSNLNNHQEFIKRIIGLPGETVRIDENGNIYVDEKLIEENYGKDVMVYAGIASEGVTLKENEYFVLGDNRNNSKDSRFPDLGVVNYYQIKGRVCISLIPFVTIK